MERGITHRANPAGALTPANLHATGSAQTPFQPKESLFQSHDH